MGYRPEMTAHDRTVWITTDHANYDRRALISTVKTTQTDCTLTAQSQRDHAVLPKDRFNIKSYFRIVKPKMHQRIK